VVAPQTAPSEGMFRLVGTPVQLATALYLSLDLYIESRSSRSDQPHALSGRCEKRLGIGESDPIRGVLGTARNGQIELALLRRWSARDTIDIFTGEVRGDTIAGRFRGSGGVVHFVRQR
jgi:hypothetical protein